MTRKRWKLCSQATSIRIGGNTVYIGFKYASIRMWGKLPTPRMQLTARPAIPVIMDHTKHMFRQGKLDQSMSTKVGKGKEREKNRTIISGAKATTNDDGQL